MRQRLFAVLNVFAKYLFIAAVAASFIFYGWRIVTKPAYTEHEKEQCRALAVTCALAAADALSCDSSLAEYVVKEGSAVFITDHKKFPGNYNITLTFSAEVGEIKIDSDVKSGWNTRSPQTAAFTAVRKADGTLSFGSDSDEKFAKDARDMQQHSASGKISSHTFTFPFEKPCPVKFSAESKNISGPEEKPLYVITFLKKAD